MRLDSPHGSALSPADALCPGRLRCARHRCRLHGGGITRHAQHRRHQSGKSSVKYKAAVRDRGYRLISVYSFNEELLEKRWPRHADGDDVSLYARDADGVLEQLEPYRADVRAVLSANDSSVGLADHLAHALGLPGNCVELAYARNHKNAMRQVAERAGLRIPRYRSVTSIEDIPAAAREVGFPAIAKHTSGGGSYGATLLADEGVLTGLHRLETFDHFREPVRAWLWNSTSVAGRSR
ncbi:acetyl-CoA carboxylase biotin carboxylase subunit family protein [Streptomyces sp. NPDC018019]|uniref:acetyl-CoA carboxylase biotin carboxylase subunit family protein n=1 Tax=Streptomyces sp. NPDC018019 TaxID=3365030 RepID=UPI0037A1359A